MEYVVKLLTSENAGVILLFASLFIILLISLVRRGLVAYKGKGLRIGLDEGFERSILLKQANWLIMFGNMKTEQIIKDVSKLGIELDYLKVEYVMDRMIQRAFVWILTNHMQNTQEYVSIKAEEAKMVAFKSISKANHNLFKQHPELENYFGTICHDYTVEIINGLLELKKLEGGK